jgi:hypothetical protein
LAWAEKNGVTPPAFAVNKAKRLGLHLPKLAVAGRSCCSAKACCSSREKAPENEDTSPDTVGWRALACGGQSLHWLAAVPALITVELDFFDHVPLAAWLGPHSSDVASPFHEAPTPPPPERA